MSKHVFVYGSLMRGFHNYRLMNESEFVGEAMTATAEFRMGNVGSYPEISRDNSDAAGFVAGELFLCSDGTLSVLDDLEGNGRAYQRELVPTRLVHAASSEIVAWVYIWIKPPCPLVEPDRVENGRPVYQWRLE